MADGSLGSKQPSPDVFPAGTQLKLCSVAMALGGAAEVFQSINNGSAEHCGIAGILDLAVAELTRIADEIEVPRGN